MNRFRNAATGLIAAAVFTGCTGPPTPPTTTTTTEPVGHVIDHEFTEVPGTYGFPMRACYEDRAVTYVAGRTGQLDQVSVVATRTPDAGRISATIYRVDSTGRPFGQSLGRGLWDGPSSPDLSTFVDIPITPPADVVAGDTYGIVFLGGSSGSNCPGYGSVTLWGHNSGYMGEDPDPAALLWHRGEGGTWWANAVTDLLIKIWID